MESLSDKMDNGEKLMQEKLLKLTSNWKGYKIYNSWPKCT